MVKIKRRTRLSDHAGVRLLRHLHREEAATLVSLGVIAAEETARGEIVSFRLKQGARVPLDSIRAGSFSVHREHFPVGADYGLSAGVVFSHQSQLYEGVAA